MLDYRAKFDSTKPWDKLGSSAGLSLVERTAEIWCHGSYIGTQPTLYPM